MRLGPSGSPIKCKVLHLHCFPSRGLPKSQELSYLDPFSPPKSGMISAVVVPSFLRESKEVPLHVLVLAGRNRVF
jgi:hypothetical protein